MHRRHFHVLISLLFICLPLLTSGQEYTTHVRHYNVEDGLSDRFVYDIYKDDNGFVWLGTNNGLNRFDGYSFDPYNSKSKHLGHTDLITDILVDEVHNLWLCYIQSVTFNDKDGIQQHGRYFKHLDIFNPQTLERVNYYDYFEQPPFQLDEVFLISNLREKQLYSVTKDKRIFKYTDTFEELPFPEILKKKRLLSISQDGTIYAYDNGIIEEYDLSGQVLQQFSYPFISLQYYNLNTFEQGRFTLQAKENLSDKNFKFYHKNKRQETLQLLDL